MTGVGREQVRHVRPPVARDPVAAPEPGRAEREFGIKIGRVVEVRIERKSGTYVNRISLSAGGVATNHEVT